jgi:hypothetical protein
VRTGEESIRQREREDAGEQTEKEQKEDWVNNSKKIWQMMRNKEENKTKAQKMN